MFNDFDLDIQKIGVDYSVDQVCCGNMGGGIAPTMSCTGGCPPGGGGATHTWSGNLFCQMLGGC